MYLIKSQFTDIDIIKKTRRYPGKNYSYDTFNSEFQGKWSELGM